MVIKQNTIGGSGLGVTTRAPFGPTVFISCSFWAKFPKIISWCHPSLRLAPPPPSGKSWIIRHFRKYMSAFYSIYTHVIFSNDPTCPISFSENLVPNLMIELYFVIQLLTVRGGDFESLADVSPGNIQLTKVCCFFFYQ